MQGMAVIVGVVGILLGVINLMVCWLLARPFKQFVNEMMERYQRKSKIEEMCKQAVITARIRNDIDRFYK